MQRLFGTDILHTWVLGFVEACVGFSLQIIKYIGYSNVDSSYSDSPRLLTEIIKNFPAFNSLHPTKKHVRFEDVFELMQSSSSKKTSNPMHTTSILKMRESGKLPSLLLQIFFSLAEKKILPSDMNWSKNQGFEQPYFSPQQIMINALNAVLEVHFYFKSGALTEGQLQTLQMLIANAQAHMLVFDVMRRRIIEKATTVKDKFLDISVSESNLMNNLKFEAISHMVEAFRQSGCDNNSRDTEMGEMMMKLCKLLFGDTSRRYHTVLRDMLIKYMHLQYMAIAEKGFNDANITDRVTVEVKKSHNTSETIAACENFDFKTNKNHRLQKIRFFHSRYQKENPSEPWNVHPMLTLVIFYCTLLYFFFFFFLCLHTLAQRENFHYEFQYSIDHRFIIVVS